MQLIVAESKSNSVCYGLIENDNLLLIDNPKDCTKFDDTQNYEVEHFLMRFRQVFPQESIYTCIVPDRFFGSKPRKQFKGSIIKEAEI